MYVFDEKCFVKNDEINKLQLIEITDGQTHFKSNTSNFGIRLYVHHVSLEDGFG